MWCSDPFLTYLKSVGYNTIRLPRADIQPLQVLARKAKDLDRLGDLVTVLVSGSNISVPTMKPDIPAANISGQRTSDLSIGIGLSILGTIIGAMGGSKLGLDAKYSQAKTAYFEFSDVLEDRINVAELDQYLADADVNPFSRSVGQLLEADEVYVITSTIKSTKFTIEASKSDGAALEVSIPEIQGVVGGNVGVKANQEVKSKVTYEGKVPLVFGFQAVRLFYERGTYTALRPLDTGKTALRALEDVPDDGAERLMTDAPFIQLQE